jgi:hypothetical protein
LVADDNMAADVATNDAASSRDVSGHGLKWRKSFHRSAVLALVVTGRHSDAAVGPSGIDSAAIVLAEKLASLTTVENHRFAVLDDLQHHLVDALAGVVPIRVDQPWLAEHIEIVALDEQVPFAARSAMIAFELRHCRIVARGRASASRCNRKSPVESTGRPERRQAQ